MSVSQLSVEQLRQQIRNNDYKGSTSGLAHSYLQANLVILPKDWANEFLLFCQRNPVACPLIGMTEPGSKSLQEIGIDIDISRDVPEYHVFRNGEFESSVCDLTEIWRDDFVVFVLGCSFSFEDALMQAGLRLGISRKGAMCRCTTHSWRVIRRVVFMATWWCRCDLLPQATPFEPFK
ncbi:hypothetical protein possibly connected to lactam utilization and allophanate hydrolase [Vibrio maritimus]|uniref:DUF1445 domain-containing protein n=1 Tax=Vibrio maritimus TaxID=990268 RepID=A0A090S043_9VIBR|nr:hypothetical protein possibly connected to lactam utilization and allophanate hydrolase [Vibrio maritimus]